MITSKIEQELKNQDNKIIYNEPYEVKYPLYNQLICSTSERNYIYEFPIEIKNKIVKIIKLPFRMGRLIWETIK